LRAPVLAALGAHGIAAEPDADPASLRERMNDLYLEEVRRLRARRQAGEIAKRDYASHVEALRERFPLLSLPLPLWTE
jgi:hypothetical protein